MKWIVSAMVLVFLTSVVIAQNHPPTSIDNAANGTGPGDQFTVTNYYKQDVYDRTVSFVGTIEDILINKEGRITALIIEIGGFLGIGQKHVSEPFENVHMAKKNGKSYLSMDADKEALKRAPGLKYDRKATTWVPENAEASAVR